jgi:CTP synthase (UTP-ammonia lyase)
MTAKPLRLGLIGDFNIHTPAHRAIPRAITLAAEALACGPVDAAWIATPTLARDPARHLAPFAGLWCVPGSPYTSMEGALRGIQFAREKSIPFLGTCGGFQHALIEFARHVLRLNDADHAETSPNSALPLITRLLCPMIEKEDPIRLLDGSRVRQIYGVPEIREPYHCQFGLSISQEGWFKKSALRFTGRDRANEARVLELDGHPFFIATLFQSERAALRGRIPPLVTALLQAALARHAA